MTSIVAGLRDRVSGLAGWRRVLMLIASGAATAFALPPFHVVPVLVPAFVILLWSIGRYRSVKRGFGSGFWFGFGMNAAGLYWISLALLVDPSFAWMIPFAVIGLGGLMAIYIGFVGLAVGSVRDGPHRIVALAMAWVAMEWVRSWLFTGFPWNMIATVWAFDAAPLQPAAWIGGYGLGFATVLIAAAPAAVAMVGRVGRRRFAAVVFVIATAWAATSAYRLSGQTDASYAGVILRLVQPNIAQRDKWRPEMRARHVVDQAVMSQNLGADPPTAVIWAETAAPFDLNRESQVRELISHALAGNSVALVGALGSDVPDGGGKPDVFNSLFALDPSGAILDRFDKTHLVPFGEYVPLDDVLPIARIVPGRGSFTPGPGPRTMRIGNLPPFSPLICYEIVFPGAVADLNDRPSWLLNVTNDAWFGYSTGPYQHFASAVLRAVEEGLPVVRVANTGISGVIDGYGQVRERLGLLKRGTLDVRLPVALEPTVFSRVGPSAVLGFLFAVSLLTGFVVLRRGQYR